MQTLITNGKVVTEQHILKADILIAGGVIQRIEPKITAGNAEIIDAAGCWVVPGGVDVHTHLSLEFDSPLAADNFFLGSRAAAYGGTTSIVEHLGFGPPGCGLMHQVEVYRNIARGNAAVDYGFHGVLQHVSEKIRTQLQAAIDSGIPTFKAYLTYAHRLDDQALLEIMAALKRAGGMLTVHAENHGMISYLRDNFIKEGKAAAVYHAKSRPEVSESEAIHRLIKLAGVAGGGPLYIVHLSTATGLAQVETAQRQGLPVFTETCPQYLVLDESLYRAPGDEGLKYVMSPPLRNKENREALWRGLAAGSIAVVATDHCTLSFAQKRLAGKDGFQHCPGGVPGVRARLPLIFSEGVAKGRLSIRDFVNVMAAAPARLMGLYPRKGRLAPGADADVVLIDPEIRKTLSLATLDENVDFTPFEGVEVRGWPVTTLLRGRVIVRDGVYRGARSDGRFLARSKPLLK